jgi:ribosomal protein S11
MRALTSSGIGAVMSVRVSAGATALTVMLRGPSSSANACVSALTAALLAA